MYLTESLAVVSVYDRVAGEKVKGGVEREGETICWRSKLGGNRGNEVDLSMGA